MQVANRKKLLMAGVLSLALGIVGAAAPVSAQEAGGEIWPMAWTPIFEDAGGATNFLTNMPVDGMILPFDKVQWPAESDLGPKGDGGLTTYLLSQPKADPPEDYIVFRIWGPRRRMGEDPQEHWHRELRPEVMIFGHGYSIGFSRTFDPSVRQNVGPGDGFVELPGGRHFGFSDYPDVGRNPARNVMFVAGTPPIVDKMNESPNNRDHGWCYFQEQLEYEPPVGTGPMLWRFVNDSRKPGEFYTEFNKYLPGHGLAAHTHATDLYGIVVSGTIYMNFGDNPDPHTGLPYRKMTPGTFFFVPAGIAHAMSMPAGGTQEAIVYLLGRGPSTITMLEPRKQVHVH
ncbi:MAG: hypothetical protein ABIK89_15605 [Planctomycetota bacterium]